MSEQTVPGLSWFKSKPHEIIFNKQKWACVYAIGPEGGRPMKLGWCYQPVDKLNTLQHGNWKPLQFHHVAWTLGGPLAQELDAQIHALLAKSGRQMGNGWHDITAEYGAPAVQIAAERAKIPTFTHEAMLNEVQRLRDLQIQRALNG